MISIAVLAIGAAAVITMQRGAVQGNVDARRIDTANSLTRLWMERLRRDAMFWTLPNSANPTGDNRAANSPLLAAVNGVWQAPVARLDESVPTSPGFDLLGRDLTRTELGDVNAASYCAQTRLTWLIPNDLIRAEVRVFWPRGSGVPMGLDCTADGTATTLDTDTQNKYRFVYASSAIRRTAL